MIETLETKRLKWRHLEDRDLEVVYRQFSDPDMCRYFSDPPCDMAEAKGIIEHYKNPLGKGYLRYGMFDKETDAFIGTCGYHYLDKELKQVEIGYDIWKDYWRKGYMSEALPALINICFNELDVDTIYILVHPENEASIASVRQFGFKECEPCRKPDVDPQICMKLLKSEWDHKKGIPIVIETILATDETANIIRNLYPLYLYDLSEIYGNVPNEYGIYEEEPIKTLEEQYHVQDIWFQKPGLLLPYIIFVGQLPAGFALVSTKDFAPKSTDSYLYEFFLLRPYRGKGIAETAIKQVFDKHRGKWELYTDHTTSNKRAQSFYHKMLSHYTSGNYEQSVGETFLGMKMIFRFESKTVI